jgi:hypothetical protein
MRVVMFRGRAVRRQQKIGDNKILVAFYNHPSVVVTAAEWENGKENKYTDGTVPRKMVVRSL